MKKQLMLFAFLPLALFAITFSMLIMADGDQSMMLLIAGFAPPIAVLVGMVFGFLAFGR